MNGDVTEVVVESRYHWCRQSAQSSIPVIDSNSSHVTQYILVSVLSDLQLDRGIKHDTGHLQCRRNQQPFDEIDRWFGCQSVVDAICRNRRWSIPS